MDRHTRFTCICLGIHCCALMTYAYNFSLENYNPGDVIKDIIKLLNKMNEQLKNKDVNISKLDTPKKPDVTNKSNCLKTFMEVFANQTHQVFLKATESNLAIAKNIDICMKCLTTSCTKVMNRNEDVASCTNSVAPRKAETFINNFKEFLHMLKNNESCLTENYNEEKTRTQGRYISCINIVKLYQDII